jgi:hypothetical protein
LKRPNIRGLGCVADISLLLAFALFQPAHAQPASPTGSIDQILAQPPAKPKPAATAKAASPPKPLAKPAAPSPAPTPVAELDPSQSTLDRRKHAGALIADGHCPEAREFALRAGDLDLAAKVQALCDR